MTETRDDELGAALRSLPVPPPGPGFYDGLRAELAPAARRSPAWLVPLVAAAAVLALVVGGTAVRSSLTAKKDTPPTVQQTPSPSSYFPTRTGDVLVEGTYGRSLGEPGGEWEQTTFTAGWFLDGQMSVTFRNSAGTEFGSRLYGDGTSAYTEGTTRIVQRGLAFGRPDADDGGVIREYLQLDLLQYARAMVAAGLGEPRSNPYRGRDALAVTLPAVRNTIGGSGGEHLNMLIDSATGIVLSVTEQQGTGSDAPDVVHYEVTKITTEDVAHDSDAVAGGTDRGWRRGTLEQAQAATRYPIPALGEAPAGTTFLGAAWAAHSGPTGAEGMNPVTDNGVQLLYGKGLMRFLITTRVQNPDRHTPPDCDGCDHGWQDPLHPGEGYASSARDVVLTDGQFAGATAHVVIGSRSTPHVWFVQENGLVVTVSGDLTEAELLGVAGSLRAG